MQLTLVALGGRISDHELLEPMKRWDVSEHSSASPKRSSTVSARLVIDTISMIAILAGIVYGALELRQFRQNKEREATFELMRLIQTPEFSQALTALIQLPDATTTEDLLALPKPQLDQLYHLQSTWESLGILVYRGDVSLNLIDEFYGGPILFSWRRLRPLVEYNRRIFQRESLNEWFQWLVERLEASYEGKPEMQPAHEAYRDWEPRR